MFWKRLLERFIWTKEWSKPKNLLKHISPRLLKLLFQLEAMLTPKVYFKKKLKSLTVSLLHTKQSRNQVPTTIKSLLSEFMSAKNWWHKVMENQSRMRSRMRLKKHFQKKVGNNYFDF